MSAATECDAGGVAVELPVVPDCANEVPAGLALAEAAPLESIEYLRIRVTVVSTDADAQRLGFVDSPHLPDRWG